MPRPLRYVPEAFTPQEITMRCTQGRYLLRPSKTMNRRFIGAVAYAAREHGVKVHALHMMSNHYGLIIGPPSAEAMARFMELLNRAISVEVTHLHDWPGPMWDDRYHSLPILDEASQLNRLKYQFSNGVKEFAVSRCRQWPGAHCVAALLDGRALEGEWLDRTAYGRAKRNAKPDEEVKEHAFIESLTLKLDPLPCLADKSEGERRDVYRRLVEEVEDAAREARKRTGRPVLGAKRVLEQHPHTRPKSLDRSPAPRCHASTEKRRREWRDACRAFVEGYHRAVAALRDAISDFDFPDGGILPAGASAPT